MPNTTRPQWTYRLHLQGLPSLPDVVGTATDGRDAERQLLRAVEDHWRLGGLGPRSVGAIVRPDGLERKQSIHATFSLSESA